MDNREIARALGRTDGATKVLLHRAIRQLEGIVSRADEATVRRSNGEPRGRLRGAAARGADAGRAAGRLAARLELTLVNLTELAQDELEAWELSAMRDPRNWVRPAAAAVVGATAGTALVVLRVRGSPPRAQAAVLQPARARRADGPGHRRGGAADPPGALSAVRRGFTVRQPHSHRC